MWWGDRQTVTSRNSHRVEERSSKGLMSISEPSEAQLLLENTPAVYGSLLWITSLQAEENTGLTDCDGRKNWAGSILALISRRE